MLQPALKVIEEFQGLPTLLRDAKVWFQILVDMISLKKLSQHTIYPYNLELK
jgi:hypothetical protein